MNSPFGRVQTMRTCPTCGGEGKIIKDKCSKCSGTGFTRVTAHRDAQRSGGAWTTGRISRPFRARGEPGRNGGPAGDLYITCTVRPHKIFKRDRYDLYCDVPVFPSRRRRWAAKSTMPTLGGTTKYNIPAGTQEGNVLPHPRRGAFSSSAGTNRGDMFSSPCVEGAPSIWARSRRSCCRLEFAQRALVRSAARLRRSGEKLHPATTPRRFKEKFEKKYKPSESGTREKHGLAFLRPQERKGKTSDGLVGALVHTPPRWSADIVRRRC